MVISGRLIVHAPVEHTFYVCAVIQAIMMSEGKRGQFLSWFSACGQYMLRLLREKFTQVDATPAFYRSSLVAYWEPLWHRLPRLPLGRMLPADLPNPAREATAATQVQCTTRAE